MRTRKPIHIEANEHKGKAYGRQAMWDAMRAKGTFIVSELCTVSKREASSVRSYVNLLIKAGIVEELIEKDRTRQNQPKTYRLARDTGYKAPRLNPDGTPLVEARDQMWLTMKMLDTFTYADLAIHASTDVCSVTPIDAADYCKHLLKAGYLKIVRKATSTSKALYSLFPNMNTGRYAPKVQRTKTVFDPNLNKIIWHEPIEA